MHRLLKNHKKNHETYSAEYKHVLKLTYIPLMKKEPFSLTARLRSFRFAYDGLKTLFREEHNARIHIIATIFVSVLGWFYQIQLHEWMLIVFAIGFVFAMELINSSIEAMADHVTPERNQQIKRIKDLSAAAVLISAITSVVIACVIFIPKIF